MPKPHANMLREMGALAAGESEVHLNLSLNFNWPPLEKVGFVLPLLHSLDRSGSQQRVSGNHFEIDELSLFADDGPKNNHSLNTLRTRFFKIFGIHFFD